MARIARVVVANCPHHITHRGNHKSPIFLNGKDQSAYLQLLRRASEAEGLRVWAYCLMPNHIHLIAVPSVNTSMARAIADAHRKYSRRINEREGWTGHLWANRFYSTPLDDRHLWCAARYVEMNPVRAGLVQCAADYPWSSAAAHVSGTSQPLLSADRPFPGAVTNWAEWLANGIQDLDIQSIRENTQSGRPSGSVQFIQDLETRCGRSLMPQKRGPKPRRDPSCRNSVAVP